MAQDRISTKTGLPLGGLEWQLVKEQAVRCSVKQQTAKQYDMLMNQIWNFAVEYKFPTVTEEVLWKYFELHKESRDKNLPNKLRAALEFRYASKPEMMGHCPFWRDRTVEHYAFRGLKVRAAQREIPKGAIDKGLFRELQQSAAFSSLQPRAQIAIQLLFFASLRRGELTSMTNHDYDETMSILHINQNKGGRRASGAAEAYSKLIVIPEAKTLLKMVNRMPEEHPFSFISAPMSAWEKCIREAKMELGWDDDLAWTLHSLRHGGIQLIAERVGPGETMLMEATRVSESTRDLYLVPNQVRLHKLATGRAGELVATEEEEEGQQLQSEKSSRKTRDTSRSKSNAKATATQKKQGRQGARKRSRHE
jgi:integrase